MVLGAPELRRPVAEPGVAVGSGWVAACPDEAHEFFGFITAAAAHPSPGRHLQIMFGIGGRHDLTERILPQMSGWRGSGPVRVGNGSWSQPQLDVYGEFLDAAFQLREQLGEIEPATRTFLIAQADAAASQWEQPDNGIWEVRGQPRHFLHSKLMWTGSAARRAVFFCVPSGSRMCWRPYLVPDWPTLQFILYPRGYVDSFIESKRSHPCAVPSVVTVAARSPGPAAASTSTASWPMFRPLSVAPATRHDEPRHSPRPGRSRPVRLHRVFRAGNLGFNRSYQPIPS